MAISPTQAVSGVASSDIDRALKKAFLNLDRDIMDQGAKTALGASFLNDAMSILGPAYSGSCALVSFYVSESQQLKVACTGDSRAVVGRRSGAGWEATAISSDQTGSNEDEVARLRAEHPNEPQMVEGGRLLGLAVSRAFGDSRWKCTLSFLTVSFQSCSTPLCSSLRVAGPCCMSIFLGRHVLQPKVRPEKAILTPKLCRVT